ncbi:FIST N-terminal domain-containing protein [Verrucomicrobiales bacterium BCK34]|nr:FIST N-terminal domain-containing protein [Verrucomicrobiales bacterium BCK34]
MKRNASASCLILSPFDEATITRGVGDCLEKLETNPDLVIAAVSSDYAEHLDDLIEILQIYGHATRIAGGSASGHFGVGRTSENASCLSLLFLSLPRTRIAISTGGTESHIAAAGHLFLYNPVAAETATATFESTLRSFNTEAGGTPVIGGVISGGPDEEDLFLFTENGRIKSISLSIALTGGLRIIPVVSQSCKPIGEPLVVTEVDENEVISIARRKAFSVLEETFERLSWSDRIQADGNIFAGIAATESVDDFETGHFLIRPIIGADLADGRLKLSSPARAGQTIQFQMRDPAIAEADLRHHLGKVKEEHGKPFAGLLFGGRSRGVQLYGEPNQDAVTFRDKLGEFPLAGFFTHQEIGPIGGTVFRHDHSLCGALCFDEEV